jgi:ATP-binding cassette, subfamily B, bacterial
MTGLREWWRVARMLLLLCFRADPWRSSALLVAQVTWAVVIVSGSYGLKLMADAVVAHDPTGVWVSAALMAGTAVGATALASLSESLGILVIERTGVYIDIRLMELAAEPDTIEHHERPDYVDQMALVRAERQAMPRMLTAVGMNIRVGISMAGAIGLLAVIQPALLLLPVLGLLGVAAQRRADKLARQARESSSQLTRQRRHLFSVASSPVAGKELRVFNLVDELIERHHDLSQQIERETRSASLRGLALAALSSLVAAIGCGGALLTVVYLARRGDATIGSVILTLGLTALVNGQMAAVALYSGYFQQVISAGRRLVWLRNHAAENSWTGTGSRPLPARLTGGITLREVSFIYPGTNRVVLDRLNLHIPASSIVAIVGENGSGKSTLVKLLCALYRPTSGRIHIDDTPLDKVEPSRWRSRIAGAFQDFVKFELKLSEAVGVGDLPCISDVSAVRKALDRVGAADLPATAPSGLATQLGPRWAGISLSDGQWQKTAVARAVMREEPLLRIFDEPSAALDPAAEHELFSRIAEDARSAAGKGAITVFVSHRFSTVPAADLIVVLQDGRITEVGDHQTLMRAGGSYADLFNLQLRGYL